MIHCSVGVMAYNEEANIGRLLQALLDQETKLACINEIIVIASGCTDRTEEIVREYAAADSRIQLVSQRQREGKASAVNLLMQCISTDVVVLQSADTLPLPGTIDALVAPLRDPQVGMVGGRPVPVNLTHNFIGYGVHLLWELHHQVSPQRPKMGELIAFRNVFRQIPYDTAVDEASIEPLIVGQGLKLQYAPDAVVFNKGPETLQDYIKQRKRIFNGHLYIRDTVGYQVSTMNGWRIAQLYFKNAKKDWRYFVWGSMLVGLEIFVRLMATVDYRLLKRNPTTWPIAESTKDLAEVSLSWSDRVR